jgi:hypothetical protein
VIAQHPELRFFAETTRSSHGQRDVSSAWHAVELVPPCRSNREREKALVVLVSMMLWLPECGRGFARFLQAVPCRHGTVLSPVLRSISISSPNVHLCKSHLGNEAILRYHQFGSLTLDDWNSLLHAPDACGLALWVDSCCSRVLGKLLGRHLIPPR